MQDLGALGCPACVHASIPASSSLHVLGPGCAASLPYTSVSVSGSFLSSLHPDHRDPQTAGRVVGGGGLGGISLGVSYKQTGPSARRTADRNPRLADRRSEDRLFLVAVHGRVVQRRPKEFLSALIRMAHAFAGGWREASSSSASNIAFKKSQHCHDTSKTVDRSTLESLGSPPTQLPQVHPAPVRQPRVWGKITDSLEPSAHSLLCCSVLGTSKQLTVQTTEPELQASLRA